MAREFFRIQFPGYTWDYAYADVKSQGSQVPCRDCGYGLFKWETPLIIEWEKNSQDVIGDYTPLKGGFYMVVSDRVRRKLEGQFGGFVFYPVTILHKRRKQPGPGASDAALLWWLEPTLVVPMRQEDYQWEVRRQNPRCNHFGLSSHPGSR